MRTTKKFSLRVKLVEIEKFEEALKTVEVSYTINNLITKIEQKFGEKERKQDESFKENRKKEQRNTWINKVYSKWET